jgi:hypothetical protein
MIRWNLTGIQKLENSQIERGDPQTNFPVQTRILANVQTAFKTAQPDPRQLP